MSLPKLSALQSRLAASLAASAVLILLYLALTQPQFAYAADVDSRIPRDDHNHPLWVDTDLLAEEQIEELSTNWNAPNVVGRAPVGVSALTNNVPQMMNIAAGVTQNWLIPEDVVNGPHGDVGPGLPSDSTTALDESPHMKQELRKRQSGNTVYISLNTCLQPSLVATDDSTQQVTLPQLEVYMSTSQSNQEPGPSVSDPNQLKVTLSGGYGLIEVNATDEVFIGVYAPNTTSIEGTWNYEIAGSIDAPYHSLNESWSNLFFVDSDNHAALLITNDTTWTDPNSTVYQEWLHMEPPYGMFAHNQDDTSILGVRNSYCGLNNLAGIVAGLGVQNDNVVGMTNRGLYNKPKEQFYVNSLNESSSYWGILAMEGNSTASGEGVVGGGGKVWAAINFTTKASNNCALLYNLSFCSEVAYAVPSNPDKFPSVSGLPALAALYDSNAANAYQNFNYSLQQIPCNTTSTAQYSLARNCDDCATAYKRWLCAVTIPRCQDFSNPAPWLMPRNTKQAFVNNSMLNPAVDGALFNSVATNSSRNPMIDQDIQPGPYKEVLPCVDLCYELVQSCPAALGFGCPTKGRGLEQGYGIRSSTLNVTCSYLGAVYELNGARPLGVVWNLLAVSLLLSSVHLL